MRRLKNWLGYWVRDPLWGVIDYLTYAGLRCLSLQSVSATGARIGTFARHRFHAADANVFANLRALRPSASDSEIETLAAQMWQNIGRTLTEMAVLDRFDLQRSLNIINPERLDQLDRSRPIIFIYPHLGNWELLARYIVSRGHRLNVIYEFLPNRFQRRLVESARRRSGYELISPDYRGTRQIYKAMNGGETLGIALDEFKHNRVVSPWSGDPPHTRTNIHYAVMLARKYGATIVSGYCLRRGSLGFDVVCGQVIDMQSPDYRSRSNSEIAAGINAVCRGWVQAHPEQWYMLHRARLSNG